VTVILKGKEKLRLILWSLQVILLEEAVLILFPPEQMLWMLFVLLGCMAALMSELKYMLSIRISRKKMVGK
jgi:hypothetical protein